MRGISGFLLAAGTAALLFAQPVFSPLAWAAAEPSQLVKSVIAQVIGVVQTTSGAPREAAFREILRNNFDLSYMGRLALGSHWNEASEQQRARFLAALETTEARAYGERLGKLAGFTLTIDKVVAQSTGVWIVDSSLGRAGGQPMKLEWDVRDNGRGPRITDVKVAGVSMFVTKRSEFNSYIQKSGGMVEPLVKELEVRAARQ